MYIERYGEDKPTANQRKTNSTQKRPNQSIRLSLDSVKPTVGNLRVKSRLMRF